jgi:hypothetical protein
MKPVLERGDDAEVATPTADRPEEIRVFLRTCRHDVAFGRHEPGGEQVVDGGTVLAHQPPDAAAERETGDARMRDDPARGCESEGLRLPVELAPEDACLSPRSSSARVDLDRLQWREVDHEPALADGVPADPVAAAAHRDEQVALARETDGRDHVGHPCAAQDRSGTAVDRAVPDLACVVVSAIPWTDDLALDQLPQSPEIACHYG